MTQPAAPDDAPQIDPRLILAKVEQRSELGAALVYGASMHVLAEHYAAELGRLKQGQDDETPAAQQHHEKGGT